ncbi:Peptidoglycan D,D-transpeptidase MrdA [Nocardiopsis dassonvillei]|uniref:penicillin-binding transpeptidase domain-containing protein n=1 Tax=Nocardiopsis dassonvillei TaxID=2014 RepID=UPI003F56311D
MDERSPRQPDSSGPPEESGGTPTRGVRPDNPYRIPRRPAAPDGAAADGTSDRPEAWDTPYPAAQGPTGAWNAPQPHEAPPADTWKDWETPDRPAEAPGPDRSPEDVRPGGTADPDGPRPTDDAWNRPPRDTRDGGDPQQTAAAWDVRPGDAPRGAHSAPPRGTGAWDAPADDAPTWDEQPHGAHRGADPDAEGAPVWGEQPADTAGADAREGAHSGPQPIGAWDAQPGDARGTGGARSAHSGPQETGTAWSEPQGDTWVGGDRGDSWNPAPRTADGTWNEQPGGARPADDAWDGRPDAAHQGPGTGGDDWGTPSGPSATEATWNGRPDAAWDEPQGDTWSGGGRGGSWSATPQPPEAARGERPGEAPGANDARGDGVRAPAAWDGQPHGTRQGPEAAHDARGAHSGPQDPGSGWDERPHEAHRGPDADGWGSQDDPRRGPAAWNASGGADDAYGETPRGGGRPGAPGYEDEWSGPQQGAGGWDSGDGRGGPPQGPGGPRDGWDDWDGEPRDGEPAPPGGFEYLYNDGAPAPQEPPRPPERKSRRGLVIGVVSAVVVLALIGGGVSWYVLTLPQPEEATSEYEAAWEAQDYERMAAVTTGGDPAEVLGGIATGIGVESVDVTVDEPATDGDTGTASYEVSVALSNAGDWGWEGELPLVRQDGEWLVEFSPEVAFPGLAEGQILARTAVWGERGQILAADGTRLDTPDISGSLQMIVGAMGEATEEDVERLGPAYRVGDTVGTSGLQRTYEERLAGQAATTIVKVDAGTEADAVEATEENTVASLDGAPGENVVTSIDMAVQNAAADAIIDSDDPAAMVAIRPSTGEILAAVNVPGGFNRAFEGRYPPGSTFKVVSYNALLDGGMTMDSPFDCPKEYNPGGWEFTNAGGAEYGSQTMTQAFATSCNTALVRAAVDNIDANALLTSAELFGMNAALSIGVPTFEPVYPISEGAVMLGAQAIGQGQVETSPLHMATVPAAVADGTWRPPLLVTEPAAEELPEPRPIPNAEALRTMMRAVITEGTAESLPFQGEVYGKTGTAEFGTAEGEDEELPSHAWMIGFKGDVAFAVVVEGGGGGSSVAGPIAAEFTNAL